jgi:hypothetical protein
LKHVKDYYRPNNGENKEAGCISDATTVLEKNYGRTFADEFRPRDLKTVRDEMIKLGWSRQYVNRQAARLKRLFAFAAEEDLIPGSVYHALLAVKGLRKNTPGVREAERVRPVPVEDDPGAGAEIPLIQVVIAYAKRGGGTCPAKEMREVPPETRHWSRPLASSS